jgi:AsmA family protein
VRPSAPTRSPSTCCRTARSLLPIALLIIAVLLPAAGYLFLKTRDFNRYKGIIAKAAKDSTGRELTLGGDLHLEIGFWPALVATDVAFANSSWGSQPEMLRIHRLEARLSLLKLLAGNVDLKQIAMVGVHLLLETDAAGVGNWEFKPNAGSGGHSGWPVKKLDVGDIRFEDLQLFFHDGQTGSKIQLSLRHFSAARDESKGVLEVALEGEVNGQSVVLSGHSGLIGDLFARKKFTIDLSGRMANAAVAVTGAIGDVVDLKGIDVGIRASGKNLATVASAAGLSILDTDDFDMKGQVSGSASALTLSGRLTGSAKAIELQDMQGNASARSLNLTLNGSVKDLLAVNGMNLNVRCSGGELSDIGPWVGVKLPELGRFDVKGHLSRSATMLAIDSLSAIVDQSDLNGSVTVEFRKRPKITAVLKSALIDMTPFIKMEKAEEKKIAGKTSSDRGVFPDDPLHFDKLEAVDADITLDAQNIRARNAKWEFGRLAIKLHEADLRIERLEAVYKGTKVSGSAFVHPGSPPQVATKFLVQGFDFGSFLRETQVSRKAKGYLDIAVDVSSQGNSVKTLMENLDGTVGAVMGQGRLTKYLDWLARDLTQKVIPFWGQNEKAGIIDCGAVQFDIKNGLAKSHGFVLNTPVSVLTGKGTINLATEQIQFLLKPAPKHLSLFSLATKLRVSGTIQSPEVRPDYTSLASKGARALSTFVVGPVGLLAPFVYLGAKKHHACDLKNLDGEDIQSMPAE